MTLGTQTIFPHTWTAKVLTAPPLIAPARQFVYPVPVPGEEDAMARGALQVEIKPASTGTFLVTCALGFRDPSLPSGVFQCPCPDDILLLAGGYAYLADTLHPERCLHLPLRPVTRVLPVPEENLILLAGLQHIAAITAEGLAWQSERLTWEGLTMGEVRDGALQGTGWHMPSDRDLPYTLDLRTGKHTGGGFQR